MLFGGVIRVTSWTKEASDKFWECKFTPAMDQSFRLGYNKL